MPTNDNGTTAGSAMVGTTNYLYHSDGTVTSELKNCTQEDKNYTYNPCSGMNFSNADDICYTVDGKKELYLYQQFYYNSYGYILFYSATKNCGVRIKTYNMCWHTKGVDHDNVAPVSDGLHTFKMHVITDTDTTKNVMQIWLDGKLVYDGNNVSYLNGEQITGVEFFSGSDNRNSNIIISESDIADNDINTIFPPTSFASHYDLSRKIIADAVNHTDICKSISTNEIEHADVDRKVHINEKIKYENAGHDDGIIKGTNYVDTYHQYSDTGKFIYLDNDDIIPFTSLGYEYEPKELWIRLDAHYADISNNQKIKVYFDSKTGSDYIGLKGTTCYYNTNGNQSVAVDSKLFNQKINKLVLHVSQTSCQLYVNDNLVVDKSGLNNGTKITGLTIASESYTKDGALDNNMFSNIIVANYDCSAETLRENTFPVQTHADTYTLKKLAPWRYENPGTCNLFSEDISLDYNDHLNVKDTTKTKTITGIAYSICQNFYGNMFPIPVDTEVYIKFDAWISPDTSVSNREFTAGSWINRHMSGIHFVLPAGTDSSCWKADGGNTWITDMPDISGLHRYKIHIIAGDAHGQMEVYIDNEDKPYITYTGEIEHETLCDDIGIGTAVVGSEKNLAGSCISNVIISNEYVGINDNVKDFVDHGIPAVSHGDIQRYANAEYTNHEDTSLTYYYAEFKHADVSKSISTIETEYADIKRMILDDGKIPVTVRTDIDRRTSGLLSNHVDVLKAIKNHIRTHNDFMVDKTRTDRFQYTTHNDFAVKKSVIVKYHYDVALSRLMEIKSFMDRYQEVQSIDINLNELTLSDSIKLTTTMRLFLSEVVRGKLLDYDFQYAIESTSQRGIQTEAQLMMDCDAILYQPIVYNEEETKTPTYAYDESDMAGLTIKEQQLARKSYQEDMLRKQNEWKQARKDRSWALSNMQRIASSLDKQLVWLADNYMSSNDWLGAGQTFSSIISALWGWTNRVPRRQVNVFVRGDKIYVLQRGHETQVVDLNSTAHTVPEIDREIVRTAWTRTAEDDDASNAQGEGDNLGIEHYFSGTKTNKGMSYEYADGLLMQAQGTDDQGNYTWIIYDYQQVGVYGDDAVQMRYKCEQTQGKGESTVAETYYSYASGWCTATKYVDGEYADSSEYQQSEVARVTEFSGAVNLGNAGGSRRKASLMVDRSFPVRTDDVATLEKLTQELQWMNRKTKETVKMDIYHYDHLIDFTDRLKFNGNEYYLVSNDVSQTQTELKQTVTMVRWY